MEAEELPGGGSRCQLEMCSAVVGLGPLMSCSMCAPPLPRASRVPDGRAGREKGR